MRAVVLAAGFATRMYPLTRDRAKPLLEVGGRAVLSHLLDRVLALPEVSAVTVVTNARFHAQFVEWRKAYPSRLPIELIDDGSTDDSNKLGAIGDLALALEHSAGEDDLVVCAGDNLLGFELAPFCACFRAEGRPLLLVRSIEGEVPPGRYSEVTLDEAGEVRSFREKPVDPRSNLSAICLYFFPARTRERVREYLAQPGANPDAPGNFLAWLSERERLLGMQVQGRWFDIGNKQTLEEARVALDQTRAD